MRILLTTFELAPSAIFCSDALHGKVSSGGGGSSGKGACRRWSQPNCAVWVALTAKRGTPARSQANATLSTSCAAAVAALRQQPDWVALSADAAVAQLHAPERLLLLQAQRRWHADTDTQPGETARGSSRNSSGSGSTGEGGKGIRQPPQCDEPEGALPLGHVPRFLDKLRQLLLRVAKRHRPPIAVTLARSPGEFILFTVTLCTNPAHNLMCSPSYIITSNVARWFRADRGNAGARIAGSCDAREARSRDGDGDGDERRLPAAAAASAGPGAI